MPVIVVTRLRLKDPALLARPPPAELTHPSAANQTRAFPPPVEPPPSAT
jgi:hypothetical protein